MTQSKPKRAKTVRATCTDVAGKIQASCPSCHTPVTPPLLVAQLVKESAGSYWHIAYRCGCGDKVVLAVFPDLSAIDPDHTATMSLRMNSEETPLELI